MRMTEAKPAKVKLDWSRLLGFDQANPSDRTAGDPRLVKTGNKTGTKFGVKLGTKLGTKPGIKLG